jgi:hypothetical protein
VKSIPVEPEVVSCRRSAPKRAKPKSLWKVVVIEKLANGTERERIELYTTKQGALWSTRGGAR